MVKYIRFPFGLSGDRSPIPDDADPSGSVSFAQGFGPDYELELGVAPNAKPVPRPESNELYFVITENQRDYQLAGAPPWFPPSANNGVPIPYPANAVVRHGTPPVVYRSLVATNTVEPGTDPASWAVDDPFSFSASEATIAEVVAGTSGTKLITPRRLAAGAQRTPWTYAAAGGTADAITAALAPAPAALFTGMEVSVKLANANTTAATLNVNGLGAAPILRIDGNPVAAGDLNPGIREFVYDSTVPAWVFISTPNPATGADMLAATSGYKFVTPSLLASGFRFLDTILTAGTNVPNNTPTIPAINTPISNTFLNSTVGPGARITCGSLDAGVWAINAWVQYNGAGENKSARILRNLDPDDRLSVQQNGNGEANDSYTVSATTRVVAGDIISFTLLHTMGLTAQVTQGRFAVTRIGS